MLFLECCCAKNYKLQRFKLDRDVLKGNRHAQYVSKPNDSKLVKLMVEYLSATIFFELNLQVHGGCFAKYFNTTIFGKNCFTRQFTHLRYSGAFNNYVSTTMYYTQNTLILKLFLITSSERLMHFCAFCINDKNFNLIYYFSIIAQCQA